MNVFDSQALRNFCCPAIAAIAAITLSALVPQMANAQDTSVEYPYVGEAVVPYEALVGLIDNVHLFVDDSVTDSCWTNARDVAGTIVEILRAARVPVNVDGGDWGYSPMNPRLDLSITGRRVDGNCVASAQMVLYFANNTVLNFSHANSIASIRTSQTNIMWITNQAMYGPNNIDGAVENWATQWVGGLATAITTQRASQQVARANAHWGYSR